MAVAGGMLCSLLYMCIWACVFGLGGGRGRGRGLWGGGWGGETWSMKTRSVWHKALRCDALRILTTGSMHRVVCKSSSLHFLQVSVSHNVHKRLAISSHNVHMFSPRLSVIRRKLFVMPCEQYYLVLGKQITKSENTIPNFLSKERRLCRLGDLWRWRHFYPLTCGTAYCESVLSI